MSASAHRRLHDPRYLVGHWPLNGHAQDVSGHGNHGTWTAEGYESGPYNGKSVGSFNGTTGTVACGTDASITMYGWSAISVTALVRADSIGETSGRVIDKAKVFVALGTNSIGAQVIASGGTAIESSAVSSITYGAWYRIAMVWDGTSGNIRIYIGNALSSAGSPTNKTGTITDDSANALFIGNNSAGGIRAFDGAISKVRLYNIALTGDEVAALAKFDAR